MEQQAQIVGAATAWWLAGLLSGGPVLPAQDTPPSPQETDKPAKTAQPREQLINRVELTVDNKAVLRSQVLADYYAVLEQNLAGGAKLDRVERRQLFAEVLQAHERQAVSSEAALSVLGADTEQINQTVERIRAFRKEENLKQIGSYSKMRESVGLFGQSQFQRAQAEKETILRDLARNDVLARFRDRRNLLITPKQLRKAYAEHVAQLPKEPSFILETLVFRPAEGEALDEVRARAEQAAQAWRGDLTARQVASAHQGIALRSRGRVRRSQARRRQAHLQAFPLAAEGNGVSKPIPDPAGRGFYLQRIRGWRAAQAPAYDDPAVQQSLRAKLEEGTLRYEFERAARLAKQVVHIWHNREAAPLRPPPRPKGAGDQPQNPGK